MINAGSSSIKFALYDAVRRDDLLFRGQIEGIGVAPHLKVKRRARAESSTSATWPADGFDHDAATREILAIGGRPGRWRAWCRRSVTVSFTAACRYDAPCAWIATSLDDLARLAPLAPLHQPHNLAPIRTILTSRRIFRRSPASTRRFIAASRIVAQAFALPRRLTEAGVRRYGFHGLSYEFLVSRLQRTRVRSSRRGRIVIAHLGNGASLCAVRTAAASPARWASPRSTA